MAARRGRGESEGPGRDNLRNELVSAGARERCILRRVKRYAGLRDGDNGYGSID